MPKKPSKTAVINAYGATKNIRKASEQLGCSWSHVYETLVAARVDLYFRGKGVAYLNEDTLPRAA